LFPQRRRPVLFKKKEEYVKNKDLPPLFYFMSPKTDPYFLFPLRAVGSFQIPDPWSLIQDLWPLVSGPWPLLEQSGNPDLSGIPDPYFLFPACPVKFLSCETMYFLLFYRGTIVKGNAHFTGDPEPHHIFALNQF
jgi:hypothetical protein